MTKAPDWRALLDAARAAAERPTSPEKLALWARGEVDGAADWHGPDYIEALQQALEQRNPEPLLRMLEAELPLPPALLPALAAVLRACLYGGRSGAPPALTETEAAAIRAGHAKFTALGYTSASSTAELAEMFGVSESTVWRALRR